MDPNKPNIGNTPNINQPNQPSVAPVNNSQITPPQVVNTNPPPVQVAQPVQAYQQPSQQTQTQQTTQYANTIPLQTQNTSITSQAEMPTGALVQQLSGKLFKNKMALTIFGVAFVTFIFGFIIGRSSAPQVSQNASTNSTQDAVYDISTDNTTSQ